MTADRSSALAVRAHDVFCLYPTPRGQVAALRGLTLDIATGERVVVHGPNGSGKTTLLRVLMGEIAPSAGTVEVCGVPLGAVESQRARLRGQRIGLVDQHHGRSLRPEISVRDNVALQLRLAGMRARRARTRAEETLGRLGLADLAGRRPATLSGGEAQRVAVCAAVAHEPELLFADEPTGELDQATADSVYDLLAAAAANSGAALLVVSHDARAARIADRIVRIRDGRLSEEWQPGAESSESLVVDDRGWLRLPEPLRRRTGLINRGHATVDGDSIVLRPVRPPSPLAGTTSTGAGRGEVAADRGEVAADRREVAADPTTQRRVVPAIQAGAEVAAAIGIVVDRGGRRVLDGVHLTVHTGTLTAVRGRSGSGKTTLLRVLCGLERPDAGRVCVSGSDLGDFDRAGLAALRRKYIGVAGQGTALLETMDVAENLDLVRLARHLPEDHDLVEELIHGLGLAAVRDRAVRVLSGGERQRVAVARVLAGAPKLAVLDEPTSHQDEAHAELVVAALSAAARRGVAVVVATHDPVLTASADATLPM
jgi:ABC-type lipoprotein export system ATPase subunit